MTRGAKEYAQIDRFRRRTPASRGPDSPSTSVHGPCPRRNNALDIAGIVLWNVVLVRCLLDLPLLGDEPVRAYECAMCPRPPAGNGH